MSNACIWRSLLVQQLIKSCLKGLRQKYSTKGSLDQAALKQLYTAPTYGSVCVPSPELIPSSTSMTSNKAHENMHAPKMMISINLDSTIYPKSKMQKERTKLEILQNSRYSTPGMHIYIHLHTYIYLTNGQQGVHIDVAAQECV